MAQALQTSQETLPTAGVAMGIDDLVLGREISSPVYDDAGVLLLNAGSVITAEQKQQLRAHGVCRIVVSQEDVVHTRLNLTAAQQERRSTVPFDGAVAERLDRLVGSGMLEVSNSGPALKDRVVDHGRKAYDPKLRKHTEEQHQISVKAIEGMIASSSTGGSVNGKRVAFFVSTHVTSLIEDRDNVIGAALLTNQDPGLAEQSLSTALLAMAMGVELGLDAENVRNVGIIGLVQDFGMTQVPKTVLEAKRFLTPYEFLEIQKHPMHTVNILEKATGLPTMALPVAHQIHERPDGSGYPRGRTHDAIHLFARILHVADAYIALTSMRPNRPRLMRYAAIECLLRQAQLYHVDPDMVRSLLHVLSLYPLGSLVTLSDGSIAETLRSNGEDYTCPIVRLLQDSHGKPIDSNDDSALIDLSASELCVIQALPTPGRGEIRLGPEIMVRPG